MTIEQLSDKIGANISIWRVAGKYSFRFRDSLIKKSDGDQLVEFGTGEGETIREARKNYIENITGKRIIIGYLSGDEREYDLTRYGADLT